MRRQRAYVRDWRGRFATVESRRPKRLRVPHRRIHDFGKSDRKLVIQIGRGKDPPSWDQMSGYGANAKADGLKLWRMKKAGEFEHEDQYVQAMAKLAREYAKKHPNASKPATKNQIGNAALRHEYDETGKVTPLPAGLPGESAAKATPKKPESPKKPDTRKPIDKTDGGISILPKKTPEPPKAPEPEKPKRGKKNINDLYKQLHDAEDVVQKASTANNDIFEKYLKAGKSKYDIAGPDKALMQANREKFREAIEETMKIRQQIQKFPPDLSRKISEANNFDELADIMQARHPATEISRNMQTICQQYKADEQAEWSRKGLEVWRQDGLISSDDMMFRVVRQAMSGLDKSMIRYPKVPVKQVYLGDPVKAGIKQPKELVGAWTDRNGIGCDVVFNVYQAVYAQRYLKDKQKASGWHALNHNLFPYSSDMQHEFGHVFDWYASVMGKNNSLPTSDVSNIRKQRTSEIGATLLRVYSEEHNGKYPKDKAELYDWLHGTYDSSKQAYNPEQVSGYSWEYNAKGVATGELDDDELLAEAYTDYQLNGENATKVNQALFHYLEDKLRDKGYVT